MDCDKTTLDIISEKVCAAAKTVLGNKLEKVVLFGSYARGDYREDSDIDIMILADIQPTEADKTRNKIRNLIGNYSLDLEYGIIIRLIVGCSTVFHEYSDVSPFYMNIQKEGVELYA